MNKSDFIIWLYEEKDKLVKKRLRHSSAKITLDTYTHFLDKNKREPNFFDSH